MSILIAEIKGGAEETNTPRRAQTHADKPFEKIDAKGSITQREIGVKYDALQRA